ncbi:MAG: Hint domain-containing protein [Roseobacter sp.]|jgi:hypothetical protein|nr:Hint domain-containing protein [Roseobacter sp.]
MSWLGLADKFERRFSLRGIGADRAEARRHPEGEGYRLKRGTLLFETRMMPDAKPHTLLGFNQGWPDQRSLSFQAIPGGGVSMVQVEGENIAHAAVQHAVSGRTDTLRVTFSWDVSNRHAQLTVEKPESAQITSVTVADVSALPLVALHDFIMGRGDQTFDADVIFAALSDDIEPVGPMPGLGADAMIATPTGYRPAAQLRRGDTVLTREGATVPVLHRIERTCPARGSFAPVRLRAPYFGLLEDALVAPQQRLVIDGSEVEYLFGQEAVLVPARHLVNGFAARQDSPPTTMHYCQFILPRHEAILCAGTAVESLNIGRLRRKPQVLGTTLLAGLDRSMLPDHAQPAYKELKWYDAIHLARQRAA